MEKRHHLIIFPTLLLIFLSSPSKKQQWAPIESRQSFSSLEQCSALLQRHARNFLIIPPHHPTQQPAPQDISSPLQDHPLLKCGGRGGGGLGLSEHNSQTPLTVTTTMQGTEYVSAFLQFWLLYIFWTFLIFLPIAATLLFSSLFYICCWGCMKA